MRKKQRKERARQLLELYLHRQLGYPLNEVHSEVKTLEHTVSENSEARTVTNMGYPTIDPHSHPIPTKDRQIDARP